MDIWSHTMDTDGLVLKHQAISSHSAEYTLMLFFWNNDGLIHWFVYGVLDLNESRININLFLENKLDI